MSVRARNGVEPSVAAKNVFEPVDVAWRAAPAGDVEADHAQLPRRVLPEHAEAHDADPHIARGGRCAVVVPDPFALLAS